MIPTAFFNRQVSSPRQFSFSSSSDFLDQVREHLSDSPTTNLHLNVRPLLKKSSAYEVNISIFSNQPAKNCS